MSAIRERMLELCALPGIPGCEDAVRAALIKWARPHADELKTDALGSLHVFRKGKGRGKTVILCAHMDEVGMMVRTASDEGFLSFDSVGGIDAKVLLAQRVRVLSDRAVRSAAPDAPLSPETLAGIPGVIGIKPRHLCSGDEGNKIPKIEDMYIDIGAASKEAADKLVRPGDSVVFDSDPLELGGDFIRVKAIDDRLGCAVLSLLLEEQPPTDTWFVFSVQEEAGLRGAGAAAFARRPDVALVVEGTSAADRPDMKSGKHVCAPGQGVVIPFMDGGTVYDAGLWNLLRESAEREGIRWQTKEMIAGGTDGAAIQRSRAGVPTVGMACAVRYIHSAVSAASMADCEDLLRLARAFLVTISNDR